MSSEPESRADCHFPGAIVTGEACQSPPWQSTPGFLLSPVVVPPRDTRPEKSGLILIGWVAFVFPLTACETNPAVFIVP